MVNTVTVEEHDTTADMLALVSPWPARIDAQVRCHIAAWTAMQRALCEAWAGSLHLRASDNDDVFVPVEPLHVFRLRQLIQGWRDEPVSEVTRMAALPVGLSGSRPVWRTH